MAWDPASARLFIAMQPGDLRVVKDGELLPTPFMHLDIDTTGGSRGLSRRGRPLIFFFPRGLRP